MKNYIRVHIDVGANEGKDALHFARHEPQTLVIAFEPVPELADRIRNQSTHLKNLIVVQSAVSDYEGTSILNISPESQYGDYSCSSLLSFSEKSKTDWPGRQDFEVIKQISVDVIKLDSFIISNDITHIDYLKIDTQGNDLKVLKGLGNLLSIVREGNLEAGNKEDILYSGQNTKNESIAFLQENGFEIIHIESNDIHTNEVNIYFRNISPKSIIFKKEYHLV